MREELLAAIDGLSDELMTEPSLDSWSPGLSDEDRERRMLRAEAEDLE